MWSVSLSGASPRQRPHRGRCCRNTKKDKSEQPGCGAGGHRQTGGQTRRETTTTQRARRRGAHPSPPINAKVITRIKPRWCRSSQRETRRKKKKGGGGVVLRQKVGALLPRRAETLKKKINKKVLALMMMKHWMGWSLSFENKESLCNVSRYEVCYCTRHQRSPALYNGVA